MMRRVLTVAILCSACAGTAPRSGAETRPRIEVVGQEQTAVHLTHEDYAHSVTLSAPRADVWKAVLVVHEGLKIPVAAADERAGKLMYAMTSYNHSIAGRAASTYIDCGFGPTGPRADTYRVTVQVQEHLEPAGEGSTQVHTIVSATARDPNVSSTELTCSSTGALERRIAEALKAKLGR